MHCDAPLKFGTLGDRPRWPMPGTGPGFAGCMLCLILLCNQQELPQ